LRSTVEAICFVEFAGVGFRLAPKLASSGKDGRAV